MGEHLVINAVISFSGFVFCGSLCTLSTPYLIKNGELEGVSFRVVRGKWENIQTNATPQARNEEDLPFVI